MKIFPVKTLIVCLTACFISTEILTFDYMKFDATASLLQQSAKALGRMRPLLSPNPAAKLERL
jgi:hypothetical protein